MDSSACEHYLNGTCAVIAGLTGIDQSLCVVGDDACAACLADTYPKQRNRVTASIGIYIAKKNLPSDQAARIKSDLISEIRVEQGEPPPNEGPGTELKKLLSKLGFAVKTTCQCNAHARDMDHRGVDWCRDNVDVIVGWLREEAEKQGIPFVEFAARLLIKYAIRRATK